MKTAQRYKRGPLARSANLCALSFLVGILCIPHLAVAAPKPDKSQLDRLAKTHAGRFPQVTGQALSQAKRSLPRQLFGQLNIVLLGFKRAHQKSFDSWNKQLGTLCKKYQGLDYMKIPVMGGFAGLFRYFIVRGMRKAIKAKQEKERIMPLFVSQALFLKGLKLKGKDTIALVLADRRGRIFWQTRGVWTKARARQLQAVLRLIYGAKGKPKRPPARIVIDP